MPKIRLTLLILVGLAYAALSGLLTVALLTRMATLTALIQAPATDSLRMRFLRNLLAD
jgi:hypothetical protein